jgi:hypothetical protein
MKTYLTVLIAALFLACPLLARKKRQIDPRVSALKTVFVKGNNEAAVKAREKMNDWTCFTLAINPDKADAILEFQQEQSVNGTFLADSIEKSVVSATLTAKDGDMLWSGSSAHEAGFVHTGAGSAAQTILFKLNHLAFPEVKTGFHGVNRGTCPGQQ